MSALICALVLGKRLGYGSQPMPPHNLTYTAIGAAQIIAVVITWVLAIVATFVILKVLDALMGLRVSRSEEIEGLDFSQHGEEGYIFI
jgi:ammonia channel protein AmtB